MPDAPRRDIAFGKRFVQAGVGGVEQGFGNLLESLPRDRGAQRVIPAILFAHVAQKHFGADVGGQSPLDLLGLVAQQAVEFRVGNHGRVYLPAQPLFHLVIEVYAAQFRVAVRGLDAQGFFRFGENGDVERAAAEVEDKQVFIGFRVFDGVREGGSGRLIDEAQGVQAHDLRRRQKRLPRRAAEVGRYGQHHVFNRFADFGLRVRDDVLQNQRGHLFRAVRLAENAERLVRVAQTALHLADGVRRFEQIPRPPADIDFRRAALRVVSSTRRQRRASREPGTDPACSGPTARSPCRTDTGPRATCWFQNQFQSQMSVAASLSCFHSYYSSITLFPQWRAAV